MQVTVTIEERDGLARAGYAYFDSIKVDIPHLLVVVDPDPSRQLVPLDVIKKMGVKVIMTSSYIAMRKFGEINLKEKLNWDLILYTDSGTYQAYSRGAKVDPERSVRYQLKANVDVITPVDEFSLPSDSEEEAFEKALVSFNRWKRARELAKGKLVSAPVQGGLFERVRSTISEKYVREGAQLLAIGGIVPFFINYDYEKLVRAIMPTIINRPWGALIHAFGAGHPLAFPLLVSMGVDLFDSAMYSLAAKDLRILSSFGTLRVNEVSKLRDFPDPCDYCPQITPRELLDLGERELKEFIALYNLNVVLRMVNDIRERIYYGTFTKWSLSIAHSHPRLMEGFIELYERYSNVIMSSLRAFPKSRVPALPTFREYFVSGRNDLLQEFGEEFSRAYGKDVKLLDEEVRINERTLFVRNDKLGVLTPSGIEPCPTLLLTMNLKVVVKSCKKYVRKGDIIKISFKPLKSWTPVLIVCGNKYAVGTLQTNFAELEKSRDEDIVLTRFSELVPDPSELPCRPDRSQLSQKSI